MTLLKRLAALPEISPQTIRENFTFEDFKFEILEKMNTEKPDLDKLSILFTEVDSLMEEEPVYNVFKERLALKTLYLYMAYNIDYDFLNALLLVEPIIVLDRKLENEIFQEDENYQYIKESFKEYKVNNGFSLATIMKYMNTMDLEPLAKQLQDSIGDLSKLSKPE